MVLCKILHEVETITITLGDTVFDLSPLTVFDNRNIVIVIIPTPFEISNPVDVLLLLCRMYSRIRRCVVFLLKILFLFNLLEPILTFGRGICHLF